MKRFINLFLMVSMVLLLIPTTFVSAGSYGSITEDDFATKINELKSTYVHGKYWNKYNGLGHTGDEACPCGYSTCPAWCSCACGAFIYNGSEIAGQCHGYALMIGNAIFGGNPNSWSKHSNANNVYAGDIARLDNDGHSIFIYKVDGNDIYYTDCNSIGRCMVNWNGHMTKGTLSSRLSWIYHLSGNTLTGTGGTSDNRSRWRITATDGVNIRSNAGTGYTKVGALAYNTYFYITERKQADGYTWGKTDSGWVVLDYAEHVSGSIPDLTVDEAEAIHKDEIAHVRNGYFTFRNSSSNKMMQVHGGADIDTTEVDMWDFDDSIDQRFNVVHQGSGKYKLYAECSSSGKVVDIYRGTSPITEGQKVDLYASGDDDAQLFYIWPVSDTEYVFEIAAKTGYVICPPDASAAAVNGKDGQLVVQKYTGASYQKWKLCNNNGNLTTPSISYANGSYKIDTNGYALNMRDSASQSGNLVTSVPDGTVLSVSQISSNWGYTNYNGYSGWMCLDFTTNIVTLDSITVSTMPDKTSYCTGEQFDSLGMRIKANYSNGQSEELTTGFTTSADFSSSGTKTVTVSYKGKSTTFDVTVEDVAVKDISIQENVMKKIYEIGEGLDTTGLTLIATYNNGKTATIDSGYTTDYDFSTAGTKTVTVSYGGKSTSYEVSVVEPQSESAAVWQISSVAAVADGSVNVPISLTAENVCDGNITIQYDNTQLEISDVSVGSKLSGRSVVVNKEYADNQIRITFAGTSEFSSAGEIITLTFNVLSDAEGTADISVVDSKLYDASGAVMTVESVGGTVTIVPNANGITVSNIQSETDNGKKVVTATVSSDNVYGYLARYENGVLVECDMQQPENGIVTLSVTDGDEEFKFMVWNALMQPVMSAKSIY